MYIDEEYRKRHQLSCPLIKRPTSSGWCCFFKHGKGTDLSQVVSKEVRIPYTLFSVEVGHEAHVPPFYYFRWSIPHYSRRDSNLFYHYYSEKVEWDSYESVLSNLNHFGQEIITDPSEIKRISWEICLYYSDSSITSLPYSLKREIWRTLDLNLSLDERLSQIDKCLYKVKKSSNHNEHQLAMAWEYILKYTDNDFYASWLSNVLNNEEVNSLI
jgi:hypothetical protein